MRFPSLHTVMPGVFCSGWSESKVRRRTDRAVYQRTAFLAAPGFTSSIEMSEYVKAYRPLRSTVLFVHRLHPVGLVWCFCLAHAAAAARMSWLLKEKSFETICVHRTPSRPQSTVTIGRMHPAPGTRLFCCRSSYNRFTLHTPGIQAFSGHHERCMYVHTNMRSTLLCCCYIKHHRVRVALC